MKIQVITKESPGFDAEIIEERESIFRRLITGHMTNNEMLLVQSEIVDPSADAYIRSVGKGVLELGVRKNDTDDDIHTDINIESDLIHWLKINDSTYIESDFVTKILLFIYGISNLPSQMGTCMTDWSDFRAAVMRGCNADFFDFDQSIGIDSLEKEIRSLLILMNEGLPFREALTKIENNLITKVTDSDCLSILNVTNSQNLLKRNWVLVTHR